MSVSFIIATVGRESLQRTLDSIELWPGDEVLLISEQELDVWPRDGFRQLRHPKGNDWGHAERNWAMPQAKGSFLSFMDDDDLYAPGHRVAMQRAMDAHPTEPTIFCMRLNHVGGMVLWQTPMLRNGNVGTPMFFVPNDPSKLGIWAPYYGGDCTFIQSCRWDVNQFHWSRDIVADVMGNNVPEVAA